MNRTKNKSTGNRHPLNYRMVCLLFVISFIFLFLFRLNAPTNGDTYLYARSIKTFEGPVIHIGYYFLGFISHFLLKYFGSTPLQTLSLFSVFCGSVSVASMYLFTFMLTANRLQSVLAALILMFSGAFWLFSIHGEVYIPQLAFALLSILFIMKKKGLLSSLAFLIGIAITPTTSLIIFPLVYLICLVKLEKRQVIYFLIPIIMFLIFLISWDFAKVIGIVNWAIYSPKTFFDSFSYKALFVEVLYRIIQTYGKSFNLISFVALFGYFAMYKRGDKKLWWLMMAFLLPFTLYFFNLGLLSSDHLIITFIPISIFGSYGIMLILRDRSKLLNLKYIIIVVTIASNMYFSYKLNIQNEIRDANELRRVIVNLENEFLDNSILISDYNFGMAFCFQTNKKENCSMLTGRFLKYLNEKYDSNYDKSKKGHKFWINLSNYKNSTYWTQVKHLIGESERTVYFVDRSDWPTWIVSILLSEKTLMERKLNISKIKKLKKYLSKTWKEKIKFIKIISSPSQPVYLLQRGFGEPLSMDNDNN